MDEELFIVIDNQTGKEADPYEIALHEEWANRLCYCDMDGFALMQDGTLILVDECGQMAYCDSDRFQIVWMSKDSDWVSVKERLPDFEGSVLCLCKSHIHEGMRYQEIKYFDDDAQEFCSNTDGIYVEEGSVTHWMRLPSPPDD